MLTSLRVRIQWLCSRSEARRIRWGGDGGECYRCPDEGPVH